MESTVFDGSGPHVLIFHFQLECPIPVPESERLTLQQWEALSPLSGTHYQFGELKVQGQPLCINLGQKLVLTWEGTRQRMRGWSVRT